MHVADILNAKGNAVVTTVPDASFTEAVHRLASPPRVGALVVLAPDRHVVGLFTERDVITAVAERPTDLRELTVRDVMSTGGPVCTSSDTITSVMATMTRSRYRHVPVVDRGVLSGLVSIGDLVRFRLDELQLESDVLRDVYISRH